METEHAQIEKKNNFILLCMVCLGMLILAAACIYSVTRQRHELELQRQELIAQQQRLEALEDDLAVRDEQLRLSAAEEERLRQALSSQEDELDQVREKLAWVSGEYDEPVRAVAHRGYSALAPENTLPAFRLAREKGFHYVEADIQFTADGVPVCLHDVDVGRTSNGAGRVDSLTLYELKQLDFGSWKSKGYAGTKIPTFEEFLEVCREERLFPYVEVKAGTVYSEEQIAMLVKMVREAGLADRTTWISFSWQLLYDVRNCDRAARLGYLVEEITWTEISEAQGLQTAGNSVFLSSSSWTWEECYLCRKNEIPLEIWTVDRASVIRDMDRYISGVTSNSLHAGRILSGQEE